MCTDLTMLAWSVALSLALLMPAGMARLATTGPAIPAGLLGRAGRAQADLLESLVPFAICVLAVAVMGKAGLLSALGAQIFFAAQLARAAFSLAGIGWMRLPAWFAGMAGLGLVASALFQG